jgi:cyclohexanone monooxygenase
VADCIGHLQRQGASVIEATQEAQDAWVEHVNAVAGVTLYPTCSSWYLGANMPGKPRVFMPYSGGFPDYTARCNDIAADSYRGFVLHK